MLDQVGAMWARRRPDEDYRFPGRLWLTPAQGPGRLVVFCGTDGVGKTTLIEATEALLRRRGLPTTQVKLPSNFIREFRPYLEYRNATARDDYSYRAISMAVMADRMQVNDTVVVPALARGDFVISDRYVFSGLVRLVMHGDGNETWFHEGCRFLVKPHLTFLITAEQDTIQARLAARTYERSGKLHLEETFRCQELLLDLVPANDIVVVDTTSITPSEAMDEIRLHLDKLMVSESSVADAAE
jgi:dTMP kinase